VIVARVTDSTAAIHELGIGDGWHVVPLEVEIDGARYREGPELSPARFHRLLQAVNTPPLTLPPSVDTFAETYSPLLESHESVVSIHLSSALSETVRNARTAAERLGASDRVRVVDTGLAGAAVGLLCLEAQARLNEGAGSSEVTVALARIIATARAYFSVYSLDFLYLGGRLERRPRIEKASTEDRPILTLSDGRLGLVERVEGETTRVQRMVELLSEEFGVEEPLVAAIVHAGRRGEDAAEALERALSADREGYCRSWRAPLGPVLCAHTGFDVCGVAVYPKRLSTL
jgi:DegV family protein with EDD domain